MARRKLVANPSLAKASNFRYDSEKWLPHGRPQTLDECLMVSEKLAARQEKWKKIFL